MAAHQIVSRLVMFYENVSYSRDSKPPSCKSFPWRWCKQSDLPSVTPISDIWWLVRLRDKAARQQDSQSNLSPILSQPVGHPKHLSNRSFCSRNLAGEKARGHSKAQGSPTSDKIKPSATTSVYSFSLLLRQSNPNSSH